MLRACIVHPPEQSHCRFSWQCEVQVGQPNVVHAAEAFSPQLLMRSIAYSWACS